MESKSPARTVLMAAVVMVLCVAVSAPAKAQQQPCTAPAAWFPHNRTPEQDSAHFPTKPTNCDFHQWSWNAFLWLTQTVNGELRFETFSPTGIETKPGVLDPLIGRSSDARTIRLVQQAGPDGIMVDLQGHPIYYSIHSNSTFGDFIKQNDLLDPAKLRAFDPNTSFPVDSLTLKAAWKVVAPDEDVTTFYTREAEIALLIVKDGKIVVSGETKRARVALVGLHIAGAVNGHPEMIWATFEHLRNAPDLPRPVNKMDPDDRVSEQNWTFYTANTLFKHCNINSAGAGALNLDEAKQTLSPVTQVCRIDRNGGGDETNQGNIESLNASVHAQLDDVFKNYFEVGAIWFAAFNGLRPNCTFQPGSLECPAQQGKPILTGSTQLSNATIETFTQAQSAQGNCFACHNTVQVSSPNTTTPSLPGLNVNISHVLINAYFAPSKP